MWIPGALRVCETVGFVTLVTREFTPSLPHTMNGGFTLQVNNENDNKEKVYGIRFHFPRKKLAYDEMETDQTKFDVQLMITLEDGTVFWLINGYPGEMGDKPNQPTIDYFSIWRQSPNDSAKRKIFLGFYSVPGPALDTNMDEFTIRLHYGLDDGFQYNERSLILSTHYMVAHLHTLDSADESLQVSVDSVQKESDGTLYRPRVVPIKCTQLVWHDKNVPQVQAPPQYMDPAYPYNPYAEQYEMAQREIAELKEEKGRLYHEGTNLAAAASQLAQEKDQVEAQSFAKTQEITARQIEAGKLNSELRKTKM